MTDRIAVEAVRVGERKRRLVAARVEALADSMASLGQQQPIGVTPDGGLVWGLHRLEAARVLGWPDIWCKTVEADDGLILELHEIDENLIREELTILQRGQHLSRRSAILEAIGQRAQSGTNLKNLEGTGATVAPVRTTVDLAAEMGVSERTAQNYQQIGRNVVPEAQDLLADTPVANRTTDLLGLAREVPEVQVEAATLIANGAAKSVPQALRILDPEREEPTLGDLLPPDAELPPGRLTPIQRGAFAVGKLHVLTKYAAAEMAEAILEDEAASADPDFGRRQLEKITALIPWLSDVRDALADRLRGSRLSLVGADTETN